MSRKLVFVNASSETLTIDTDGPIFPVKIDGLGTPETMIQEQKAPFQDGTTYIDALFQPRTITVEVAILKPNNFTEIDTYRRELAKKLNPKLGQGTLTYTTEGGQSYKIAAIPMSSPSFPNKDYRDPYARAQVTFYCNDPYWKKTTADTINLPTPTGSVAAAVNAAASDYPAFYKFNTNVGYVYVAFYVKDPASTKLLVCRTSADAITWSAEITVNNAASEAPSCAQANNGEMVCVYIKDPASTRLLVRRYSSDYGATWSSESTVNNAISYAPNITKKLNGDMAVVYQAATTFYPTIRTGTFVSGWGTWSGATTLWSAASNNPSLAITPQNTWIIAYTNASENVATRSSTDGGTTWGAEIISANTTGNFYPKMSIDVFGTNVRGYSIIYFSGTLSKIAEIKSLDLVTWSDESAINAEALYTLGPRFGVVLENAYTAKMIYVRSSDRYLYLVTRTISATLATVTGDYNTPISVTFTGPSTNPRIVNADTLEYIRLNTTLAAGDTFVVNTAFGNKTVTLTQCGIVKNGTAFLDIGSTFFQLTPGANTVYFEDDAVASTATASMTWTERYVGI